SNAFGGTVSSNATLIVDSRAPKLAITAPTHGQRLGDTALTVHGTASDDLRGVSVWHQVNGAPWSLASSTNSYTNWTANVMLTPGTNSVRAYAIDLIGNHSVTSSVSFVYVVTNRLLVVAAGQGKLSPNYSNAWLEVGRGYKMTAAGVNGHVFTYWIIS